MLLNSFAASINGAPSLIVISRLRAVASNASINIGSLLRSSVNVWPSACKAGQGRAEKLKRLLP
jgi:hypothetical protein